MFEPTSRYYNLTIKAITTAEGQKVSYVNRRWLPPGQRLLIQGKVIVQQGDRLDHISTRTLGDPQQFWQICDGNNAMNPTELTAELGRYLRIPMPQV